MGIAAAEPVSFSDVAQVLDALEAQCAKNVCANEEIFHSLAERVQVVSASIEELGIGREVLDQRTSRQARALEDSATLDFSATKQARRDSEVKQLKAVDSHLHGL